MLGTPANDFGHTITVDNLENVHVAGSISSLLQGYPFAGNEDIVIAQYTNEGDHIVTNTIGTADNDRALSIALSNDGYTFISGYSQVVPETYPEEPNMEPKIGFIKKIDLITDQ